METKPFLIVLWGISGFLMPVSVNYFTEMKSTIGFWIFASLILVTSWLMKYTPFAPFITILTWFYCYNQLLGSFDGILENYWRGDLGKALGSTKKAIKSFRFLLLLAFIHLTCCVGLVVISYQADVEKSKMSTKISVLT